MAVKSLFVCEKCDYQSSRWLGKCPQCQAWNSLVEKIAPDTTSSSGKVKPSGNGLANTTQAGRVETLEALWEKIESNPQARRYPFSASLLNQFWNGGLPSGSLTLLAGEPGLGKSTLALQLLKNLWQGQDMPILDLKESAKLSKKWQDYFGEGKN